MTLHHEVTGPEEAPVLVLAGSLGTDLRMWDRQLPLASRLRLVRLDLRGHGGSPVPPAPYTLDDLGTDVVELMDALGLERASFCGVSLGGMVGMWLGINAPERIERLVLICTAPHMPPPSMWQERAAKVREAGSPEPIADAVTEGWLTPPFASAYPEIRAELRQMLAGSPAEGYIGCCAAIEQMDLRAELSQIGAPTLVISGSEDPATPIARQREIAEAIPGAHHQVIEPARHLAAVEQPEAVNRLIAEHLE